MFNRLLGKERYDKWAGEENGENARSKENRF